MRGHPPLRVDHTRCLSPDRPDPGGRQYTDPTSVRCVAFTRRHVRDGVLPPLARSAARPICPISRLVSVPTESKDSADPSCGDRPPPGGRRSLQQSRSPQAVRSPGCSTCAVQIIAGPQGSAPYSSQDGGSRSQFCARARSSGSRRSRRRPRTLGAPPTRARRPTRRSTRRPRRSTRRARKSATSPRSTATRSSGPRRPRSSRTPTPPRRSSASSSPPRSPASSRASASTRARATRAATSARCGPRTAASSRR